jgi:hypothetical protein
LVRGASLPVALAVVAALVLVAAVQAALPPRGAEFSFADHATTGKDWHVDFTIDAKHRDKIRTLIVYSEQCDATVVKRDVPISPAGVVAAGGGVDGGGTWAVNATFQATKKIVGTMRITRATCDTGVLSYPNAITGDGTGASDHSEHEGLTYPDFASATAHQRRQAVALQKRVVRTWRGITVAGARRLGFIRRLDLSVKPGMFHVYNSTYEQDNRIFDARRPESIVFWRPPHGGTPQVLGTMFRVPAGKRPSFGGPIPIYHHHGLTKAGKVASLMTHVWMVSGPKSAWAFCLPVKQLELFNSHFNWLAGYSNHEHIGGPCPS